MPRSSFYYKFHLPFVASVFVISLFCNFCKNYLFILFMYFLAPKLHRVRWYSSSSEQVGIFQNDLEYFKSCTLVRISKISAMHLSRLYLSMAVVSKRPTIAKMRKYHMI